MYRTPSSLGFALAIAALFACTDSGPNAGTHVSIQDQCDAASFNAALGAGSCTTQGTVTFAQFNSELSATQRVATWQFEPVNLTVRVGQSISATNNGGAKHTFTEVAQFGGGIVPSLNQASGNPVEAPECQQPASIHFVSPGTSFTTDAETTVGTANYQCCIHPWMRTTVTVTS
jgi:plastocyanin